MKGGGGEGDAGVGVYCVCVTVKVKLVSSVKTPRPMAGSLKVFLEGSGVLNR
jgi:hypothetical protein